MRLSDAGEKFGSTSYLRDRGKGEKYLVIAVAITLLGKCWREFL